jgi:hypothetical protein
MALTDPPSDLHTQTLPLAAVTGTLFRISRRKYSSPIYWSRKSLFRFDSPAALHGVFYTGRTFETSLLEVFGDQWKTSHLVTTDLLREFDVCEISLAHRLKVVDLDGKNLNRLGTDSNIFASTDYDRTRLWANAFMAHPDAPHGIRYPSRKNQKLHNFALFETTAATSCLTVTSRYPLLNHPHLYKLLNAYSVELI